MMKYSCFISIILGVFCLASCKKSESPDLHFLELKGNVKSVIYYETSDVNSSGKKTRKSQRCELETYNLSEDGKITTINYGADHGAVAIRITRNKKGQIETISEVALEADGGDTKKYTWNTNGYPLSEEYTLSCGEGWTCNILYNDSNEIIGKNYYEYWEEECLREWSESYTIMQVDAHGNWIKRLCETSGRGINGYYVKYSLEERVIAYYEDAQKNSSGHRTLTFEKAVSENRLEDLIYAHNKDYAVFEGNYKDSETGDRLYIVFWREDEMAMLVWSKNLQRRIVYGPRYNYELRGEKVRLYNGYYKYIWGKVAYYQETNALFSFHDGELKLSQLKRYGNRTGYDIEATLIDKTLSEELLQLFDEWAKDW